MSKKKKEEKEKGKKEKKKGKRKGERKGEKEKSPDWTPRSPKLLLESIRRKQEEGADSGSVTQESPGV